MNRFILAIPFALSAIIGKWHLGNLRDDISEATNLIDLHPETSARLKIRLKTFETEFRKTLRPAGVAE